MSIPECPKQFVDVMGCGKTMIQATVERFAPLCPLENFWVVTSAEYVDMVRRQLPQIPVQNILAEPAMRNTAPCIAYACWKIRQQCPDANVVVTPADALVVDVDDFRRVIAAALDFTAAGRRIVTVGIRPTRPETGYGYIEIAGQSGDNVILSGAKDLPQVHIHKVDSFREKPALDLARQYLAAGNYLWNAGIFVWSVETIVASMRAFVPDLAAKMDEMSRAFYTADEPAVVRSIFPTCEKISIDYAVMEKADYIYTVPGDFGWSDVGTWGSLWTLLPHDEDGNAVVGENVHLNECKGCIVHAPGAESVVLQGLEDSIVVERDGRLLICRLSDEQRIKDFRK
jgi:mannose-1-phosphate guanylyltransferase